MYACVCIYIYIYTHTCIHTYLFYNSSAPALRRGHRPVSGQEVWWSVCFPSWENRLVTIGRSPLRQHGYMRLLSHIKHSINTGPALRCGRLSMCVYIYIQRERYRARERYIYIYIYIEREREIYGRRPVSGQTGVAGFHGTLYVCMLCIVYSR